MIHRILVVEDQDDLREICALLRGAEGIAKAETELPDLVLIDIQLPVLECYESTRRIKALLGMARTSIIAVSSFAMKGDEEKARPAGSDGYVTKP